MTMKNNHFTGASRKAVLSEKQIHALVAEELRLTVPDLIFITDSGSGAFFKGKQGGLTKVKMKKLNARDIKPPDLFIALPYHSGNVFCAGLYCEIKTDESKVYKKRDGAFLNEHVEGQAQTMNRLRLLGYDADFTFGVDGTLQKIYQHIEKANSINNFSITIKKSNSWK